MIDNILELCQELSRCTVSSSKEAAVVLIRRLKSLLDEAYDDGLASDYDLIEDAVNALYEAEDMANWFGRIHPYSLARAIEECRLVAARI